MKDPLRGIVAAYRLNNWLQPVVDGEEDLRYFCREAINRCSPVSQDVVVATVHPRGCLLLCPEEYWTAAVRKIQRLQSDLAGNRQFQRLLLGYATPLHQDNERITVTTTLLDYSRIDEEAILLPFEDGHTELWNEDLLVEWMKDPDAWARRMFR